MTRPDDPAVISALVDRLLAQSRTPAKTSTPSAAKPKQTKTPTPAVPSSPPAPTKKSPDKGVMPVKFTPRTKTPAAKSRKAAPKPIPKPAATITLAPGANLVHERQWTPPKPYPTPAKSAHYLKMGVLTPCYVCGGECDEKADQWGNWRRHRDCMAVTQPWERVRAAALWFSVPATDNEAWSADLFVADYADVHPSALYDKKDADRSPWSHVSLRDVVRAVLVARQGLALTEEARACELGPCAWCGVVESLDWTDKGHRRADKSEAPLCASCGPIYDRMPDDPAADYNEQRTGMAESMTGVVPDLLEVVPTALRAHAEIDGGNGQPWSHLPAEAVEMYRWEVWGRYGGAYAPAEHKAEAVARAEAMEADRAARTFATQTADHYGFAGDRNDKEGTDG